MALFDFLKKRDDTSETSETNNTQTDTAQQEPSDLLIKALLEGNTITRDQAMSVAAVSGAVNFIANAVASMPIKLYKEKDGKVEAKDDDPRVQLLNGSTGDTLNAYQMKRAMVEDYLLNGAGYAYIRRDKNDVTGLFYVDNEYVTVLINANPIYKERTFYVYDDEFELFEMLKLLRNTKDGAQGVGVIKEVNTTLETAFKTLLYQLQTVKRGGARKGFLKSKAKLTQEAINKLKKAWVNMYENNSESVVVLNNGIEFQESSDSSVDMQLDQNKKTLTDEINNIFNIYPKDFHQTFKEAIYPVVKAFEAELNNTLLLEKEKKNHFFELDVKEIVRANLKERYEAYKLAKETGFMTINEIRRAENMEYIEGMDVINVGLSAVLFDKNTGQYFVPNMNATGKMGETGGKSNEQEEFEKDTSEQHVEEEVINHDIISEEEKDGNIQ